MNDIMVHAGDFIDPDKIPTMLKPLLSMLNFKELHWVLGNYDRDAIRSEEHTSELQSRI